MTIKEIIDGLKFTVDMFLFDPSTGETYTEPRNDMDKTTIDACRGAIKLLEQQPCEMTVEEYRQRMIDTFNNANCDNLIALVALPSEKEFEHLEWLLKNHYHNQKQQPCEDCISREDLKRKFQEEHDLYVNAYGGFSNLPVKEKARVDEITSCIAEVVNMPSVYSKPKTEHWNPVSERLPEESLNSVIGWDAHRERCVFVQYIDGHFQITGSDESFDIVAWMPLPEPYKAESEE